MSARKLAYANQPGIVHVESAWVESRRSLYGETKEQAEAAIKDLIEKKTIVVVE